MADKSPDVFDFDAAVRAARHDYPVETRDITFVDLSAPGAEEKIRAWYKSNLKDDISDDDIKKDLNNSGFSFWSADTNKGLLALNRPPSPVAGMSDARFAQYAFNHELGHLIVPNGSLAARYPEYTSPRNYNNEGEAASDCFAILHGLWKKTLSPREAQELSLRRAVSADIHLTSLAIDELLTNRDNIDYTKLDPQKIKGRAGQYAAEFTPTWGVLADMAQELLWQRYRDKSGFIDEPVHHSLAKRAFAKVTGRKIQPPPLVSLTNWEWLANLADICSKAPEDSFTSYISAKILAAVLNTGKLVNFDNHEKTFNVSARGWDKLRRDVAARARKADAPLIRIK